MCPKCKINDKHKTWPYCYSCQIQYALNYQKSHPEIVRLINKKKRKVRRDYVQKEKDKPCMDCGIKYPYYVMDFDHVRGEKKFNLSSTTIGSKAYKRIEDEIAKCDVVCANCHRARTYNTRIGAIDANL